MCMGTHIHAYTYTLRKCCLAPQFSSVAQSCPTFCNPMDCSTLGSPVHHQLPELAQTNIHGVRNAIQPPHLLSSPSTPAFNLSQHQGLFQWVSSLHQVAKVLELLTLASILPMNIQDWFPLGIDWLDLLAVQEILKSLFQHHSSRASILQCSANSHIHTWLLEKPELWIFGPLSAK